MTNPNPSVRRSLTWTAWWLRWLVAHLRHREAVLSRHAERPGPFAHEAEVLAGDLGCILADYLAPAVEALERAARDSGPFRSAGLSGDGLESEGAP